MESPAPPRFENLSPHLTTTPARLAHAWLAARHASLPSSARDGARPLLLSMSTPLTTSHLKVMCNKEG
jgi:hypothetical protein